MIILATNKHDGSTNDVIDWLLGKNATVIRVDEDNPVQSLKLATGAQQAGAYIKVCDQKIDLNDIQALWHRKGNGFFVESTPPASVKIPDFDLAHKLNEEWRIAREYLYFLLGQKKTLGNYFEKRVNKLIVQHLAQAAGLKIPQSFILNTKEAALNIDIETITKAIAEIATIPLGNQQFSAYTTELSQDFLRSLPEQFFPALMQEKIEKKYELRVFYLDGKCYSMAIFSQLDQQTQADFRVYNMNKPNRTVPYQLPQDIEHKVQKLMQSLELNTGSLDFIVNPSNEFYFLEVNPVGQFGMVSQPCNYYLEEKIADYLTTQ